jgi:hypothetical protein
MSTKVVTILMKRLLDIDAICNPDRQQQLQQTEDASLDKFTRAKRNLAKFMVEIRQDLKNRDNARGTDSPHEYAARGYEIRQKITRAEEMGDELEQIHKKKNGKLTDKIGKDKEDLQRQADSRKQIIDLMHLHLKQIQLEQAKTGREVDDSVSSIEQGDNNGDTMLMQMNLQDMDDPAFDNIKRNEMIIDEGLGRVHEGVKRLKALSLQVGDILDEQGEELDRLNILASEVNEELKSANHVLAKVVKDVKSPAMFCCDCILCLMVVGIAIGLYFAITN